CQRLLCSQLVEQSRRKAASKYLQSDCQRKIIRVALLEGEVADSDRGLVDVSVNEVGRASRRRSWADQWLWFRLSFRPARKGLLDAGSYCILVDVAGDRQNHVVRMVEPAMEFYEVVASDSFDGLFGRRSRQRAVLSVNQLREDPVGYRLRCIILPLYPIEHL